MLASRSSVMLLAEIVKSENSKEVQSAAAACLMNALLNPQVHRSQLLAALESTQLKGAGLPLAQDWCHRLSRCSSQASHARSCCTVRAAVLCVRLAGQMDGVAPIALVQQELC